MDDSSAEPRNILPDQSNLDATDILLLLQSKLIELIDTSDHGKDLETYLKYCKDVVFAGVEQSFEDHEEDQIIEDLWNFYQTKEDNKSYDAGSLSPSSPHKRPRKTTKKEHIDINSKESHKEREIRRMISNMDENRFCYIPPRSKVKRHDNLHYTRKKGDGAYVYAAHADYYILLRSCARVAQLDVRSMHAAVLTFERRLAWLEKDIDHCLKQMPSFEDCQLCHDDEMTKDVPNADSVDFSKLSL